MKTRKFIVVVFSLMVFLITTHISVVQAVAPGKADLQYKAISMVTVSFDLENGTASLSALASSKRTDTETELCLKLQRRKTGTDTWITISKWSNSSSGDKTVYISKPKKVSSGYDYRATAVVTIVNEDGDVIETTSVSSASETYE